MEDEVGREENMLVEIIAFGHKFRLLPGLAEDLITLEREGVIYSEFCSEESNEFNYYKIRLLPGEIYRIVEAHVAKQKFDDVIDNGGSFEEALEAIDNVDIVQRINSYGNYGKTKTKDGNTIDIRGCIASFYTEELEDLLCGQRKSRYELLPNFQSIDKESAILEIIDSFQVISKFMANRKHKRPAFIIENEYDVQDLLYCIIRSTFRKSKLEEWTPKLAGKSKRVDIVLPDEEILVETKCIRNSQHTKTIVDELMIDIESYHSHPNCKKIIFFIWDPNGYIIDPFAITDDLSGIRVKGKSQFSVRVIIRS